MPTHCDRLELQRRIEQRRAQVHAGMIATWKRWKGNRTPAQQHEMDQVVAIALHHLAECDRMEQSLKQ